MTPVLCRFGMATGQQEVRAAPTEPRRSIGSLPRRSRERPEKDGVASENHGQMSQASWHALHDEGVRRTCMWVPETHVYDPRL